MKNTKLPLVALLRLIPGPARVGVFEAFVAMYYFMGALHGVQLRSISSDSWLSESC